MLDDLTDICPDCADGQCTCGMQKGTPEQKKASEKSDRDLTTESIGRPAVLPKQIPLL